MEYLEQLESTLRCLDTDRFYHLQFAHISTSSKDKNSNFVVLNSFSAGVYMQFNGDGSIMKIFPYGGNHVHLDNKKTQPKPELHFTECDSRLVGKMIPVESIVKVDGKEISN